MAELRFLRVAPELWRQQGIGKQLSQTAIAWCRDHGMRSLILNITSPQIPALGLYFDLGFMEAGRYFKGMFEMVLLELEL
ncbi:MAG TPA: GNAT family N-acetyltransferase [Dehalococcoidia bacterium]|nr:hypothetical protein [Dehalococcoidia bacterium]HIM16905.1 GNAT family N-acetyltransferase [Dehalococcoidia bacterium]HIM92266.1 GNAT family N-acetyltransferase [Dehalococcoidia bacterium]